jgi:hypothetical protein
LYDILSLFACACICPFYIILNPSRIETKTTFFSQGIHCIANLILTLQHTPLRYILCACTRCNEQKKKHYDIITQQILTKLIMKTSTTWQLLNSKLVNSNKLRGASSISTRYFLCSKHNNSYKFKGTLYTTLLTLFYTHLLHRICLLKLANNYHHNQWAYNAWIIFVSIFV